jgi:ribosome-binding protein aMBF1 (putative translation factor)
LSGGLIVADELNDGKDAHQATVASIINEARNRRGLTRRHVAKEVGTTEEIVELIESGVKLIDIVELRNYCQALGVSLSDIVAELEEKCQPALKNDRPSASNSDPPLAI